MRTNLPTTLLIAGLALLGSACASPAAKTERNIQTASIGQDEKVCRALHTLAQQVKSDDSCECHVTSIRHCKAGTICPHVHVSKGKKLINERVKLPACIGIYLKPVDKDIAGGAAEYFFDEQTGELLGYDIWE